MFRKFLAVVGIAVMVLMPIAIEAARVAPMMVEVSPSGRGSVARVELTNPAQTEFPVEARVFRGVITEAGEVELTPADDQFLVFPTQVVVPARSQQVFRIQYVGEPNLATSEMYYVTVRQVPVALNPGQNRLQIVVNFNVLVNVIPPGTRAQPVVESAEPSVRETVAGVQVRVTNRGTRYFNAGLLAWTISGRAVDGTEVSLRRTPTEMSRTIGVGVVAPGRTRVFFVPTERPMAPGSVRVALAS